MNMQINYTPEMTDELISAYKADPSDKVVAAFALKFNKTTKSIVAKLTREKVYTRKEYRNKAGNTPISKQLLVQRLATLVGETAENFNSLEKANKQVLEALLVKLEGLLSENA
jgi:hypothetical protein